jgi:hypothetical protein
MRIFLDLVNVAIDDDARRDVRRRRDYAALQQGSDQRVRLIEELCNARLLSRPNPQALQSTGIEQPEVGAAVEIDQVDIIHEALIRSWDNLKAAIAGERQSLRRRARFEQALEEWQQAAADQQERYLLDGIRLAEAQELERCGDIALQNEPAKQLLRLSLERREADRDRTIVLMILAQPAGYNIIMITAGAITRAFLQLSQAQLEDCTNHAWQTVKRLIYADQQSASPYLSSLNIPTEVYQKNLNALAEVGRYLYDTLFYGAGEDARALGDLLATYSMRAPRRIQIIGDRFLFPWGLLYSRNRDGETNANWEDFWGLRHSIEYPLEQYGALGSADSAIQIADKIQLTVVTNPALDLKFRDPIIVAPNPYAASPSQEIVLHTHTTKQDFINAFKDPDLPAHLIYFCCLAESDFSHGLSGGSAEARILLDDLNPANALTAEQMKLRIRTSAPQLKHAPLIFMNFCQGAAMSPYFYDQFVPYLSARGCRGIFGPQIEIPALFAAEFAQRFFAEFFKGDKTLGEVLLALRQEFARNNNNMLGLVYSLYGSSDIHVVFSSG